MLIDDADNHLSDIRRMLQNAQLDSTYNYLYNNNHPLIIDGEDSTYYIAINNCDTVFIPVIRCEESSCDNSFEAHFNAYWKDSTSLDIMKTGGDMDIAKYMPGYSVGGFDSIVDRMLADNNMGGYRYDCDTLWMIWQNITIQYKTLYELGVSITNPYSFDVLEEFLKVAGYRIRKATTKIYEPSLTDFSEPGYKSHPYCCFNYDFTTSTPKNQQCQSLCLDSNIAIDSNTTSSWNNFYYCITMQEGLTPIDLADMGDSLRAYQQMFADSISDICDNKLDGFVNSVVELYHNDSIYINGYDEYFLTSQASFITGYYPSEDTLPGNFFTSSPLPEQVDYSDVLCKALALVDGCKAKGQFSLIYNEDNVLIGLGTPTEIEEAQRVLFGDYELIDCDDCVSCPAGYEKTSGCGSSQGVIAFLDAEYERLNDSVVAAGGTYNWDVEAFLNKIDGIDSIYNYNSGPHEGGFLACSTIVTINAVDVYGGFFLHTELGSYVSDTIGKYSDYYTADIINRLMFGSSISQEIFHEVTLKPITSGNGLCVKWLDRPEIPDSLFTTLELMTCEKATSDHLLTIIEDQVGRFYTKHPATLDSSYFNQCVAPTEVPDVLTVNYDQGYYHYTLYYYDRAGNLVKTVAPKGVDVSSTDRMNHPNHKFVTEYEYNSLGQLIRQKTPDGGESNFWYNNLGQLRFSQNVQQLSDNNFSYSKYDALGRIIEVGLSGSSTLGLELGNIEDNIYPTQNTRECTNTVYGATSGVTYIGGEDQRFLSNRVSYVYTDNDGNSSTLNDRHYTYYSYDAHGNVEWLIQQDPELWRNYVAYEYDLINGNVLKVKYNDGKKDMFVHRYSYDEDGRLTLVETSKDDELWDKDAVYDYYLHGPLKRTQIGEDQVQGLDYVYTLQGWLKGINHSDLNCNSDPGKDANPLVGSNNNVAKDAFGMILGYYQGDFKHTGSKFDASTASHNALEANSGNLYNGNISNWESNTMANDVADLQYQNRTGYIYRYDHLNRLVKADFKNYNTTASQWVETADYDVNYGYDANGNITKLNRNGYYKSGTQPLKMDEMTYNYSNNTENNKLGSVSDAIGDSQYAIDIDGQSATNYGYDLIGNLTSDAAEGLSISWNTSGKVKQVVKSNGTIIKFHYDAMGNRTRKEMIKYNNDPSQNTSTYYVRDASGNVMSTYKRENTLVSGTIYKANFSLSEQSIYGSDRLGLHNPDSLISSISYTKGSDVVNNASDNNSNNNNPIGINASPILTHHSVSSYNGKIYSSFTAGIQASSAGEQESLTSELFEVTGVAGVNQAVALDGSGSANLVFNTLKTYNNKSNVGLLMNSSGGLFKNSNGIITDSKGQSIAITDPNNDNNKYLFTIGTDKKAYYHIIDMLAEEVLEKNISLDNLATYLPVMTLLEDNKGDGASHIYMQRYNAASSITEVVGIAIDEQGVAQASVMSEMDGQSVGGEMQISQDGSKLAIAAVDVGNQFLIRNTQTSRINTFNISKDHSQLTLNGSVNLGTTALAKSVTYSENGTYVYYASEAINGNKTLKRVNGSNGTVNNLNKAIIGGLIKGNDGNIYAPLENGEILMVSNTESASPGYDWASSTSSAGITSISASAMTAERFNASTVFLGGNGIVKRTKFVRQIGKKMYELKDHLGNVRVVLSDRKLIPVAPVLTDFVNVVELNGNIKNTNTSSGWTSGLATTSLGIGNCAVFRVLIDGNGDGSLEENNGIAVGLSYSNTNLSVSTINYGFITVDYRGIPNSILVMEKGRPVNGCGQCQDGDVLIIEREGNQIKYYYNGNVVHTTTESSPGSNMIVDISMSLPNTYIYRLGFGGDNTQFSPDIVSSTNYYPFGSPMPGRVFSSDRYRYGFNGMEKDDEIGKGDGNSYDFGARLYDPRLGRWLACDPLEAKYPYVSPYNFVLNSPIQAIDPDGKEVVPAGKKEVEHLNAFIIATFGENSGFKATGRGIKFNKRKFKKAGFKGDKLELANRLKEIATNDTYTAVFKLGTGGSVKNQVGTEMKEIPNYISYTNRDGTKSFMLDPLNPTKMGEVPVYETTSIEDISGGITLTQSQGGKILKNSVVVVDPASQGLESLEDTEGNPLALDNNATTAHELLGHLYDFFTASKNDSSVSTENKVRSIFNLKLRSGKKHGHVKTKENPVK